MLSDFVLDQTLEQLVMKGRIGVWDKDNCFALEESCLREIRFWY